MKNLTLDALAALLSRGSARTARKDDSSDRLRKLEDKFARRAAKNEATQAASAEATTRASSDSVRWVS